MSFYIILIIILLSIYTQFIQMFKFKLFFLFKMEEEKEFTEALTTMVKELKGIRIAIEEIKDKLDNMIYFSDNK